MSYKPQKVLSNLDYLYLVSTLDYMFLNNYKLKTKINVMNLKNKDLRTFLMTSFTAILVIGMTTSQAFASIASGEDSIAPSTAKPSQVVPTPVDCDVDTNVVGFVTNNGGGVGLYLDIADDIETNLGVTVREVTLAGSVPSCIEKLVIMHGPGSCLPGGIGAVNEAAVLDWVTNQGGELLILEEYGGCGGGSSALTAAFGATHNLNLVVDGGFPGEAFTGAALNAAHPIMAGVTTMNMQAGSDFTSDGTLATIVTDDDNNLPVMLAGPINDGCVVITGDSNWMGDPGTALDINDNRIVANNVFDFLNNICHPIIDVGGELLSIDATALLVAGAQTNAIWILSALAGIVSVAFGTLYLKTKRD